MEALARVGQGSRKLEGWWLKMRQFHGLLVKRFHCARRNSKALCSQILLPALFVCVAMPVALSVPEIGMAACPRGGGQGYHLALGFLASFSSQPPREPFSIPLPILNLIQGLMGESYPRSLVLSVLGRGKGDLGAPSGSRSLLRSHVHPPGDLPPLVLSPSQYHNYTQPRGNFIPYANEERREYR